MDPDDRELARRVFVLATAVLEDALDTPLAGQSPALRAPDCAALAQQLKVAARDLAALGRIAGLIARRSQDHG